ncbi:MAG: response regulator [Deltaproteobacteria bacterium]|nr:response regulator [Deltaproteobacteria bacterium]
MNKPLKFGSEKRWLATTDRFSFLPGDGEMAGRIRAFNWSSTPLGPITRWSAALRTTLRIILANGFPHILWWGPHYIQFYNDAYIPVLGTKHPDIALGQSVTECWPEIWHVIGPLIERPFRGGPPAYNEDLQLEIERHGFREESHFTIAYSPVPDETAPGGIGGVLGTIHEITGKVIGERRTEALRHLAARLGDAKTEREACATAAQVLAEHDKDMPFVLLYLIDHERRQAELAGWTGVTPGQDISKGVINLNLEQDSGWPIVAALKLEKMQVVDRLADRFATVPPGPWSDAPNTAVVVPIASTKPHEFAGLMIAGVSARLTLDTYYRDFFDLVKTQIASAIANARSYEEERKRAEALAELDRAKTIFFSNISHEFRTPLSLMLGPIEDAINDREDMLGPRQRERISMVQRNGLRLHKLVNTLLDFSRVEAGRIQAIYEPTDLASLTNDLASNFRSACEKAGLSLTIDATPLSEPVYVDHEMWEKVVLNLVSNAFKFTFEGGITITVAADGHNAVLRVSDTGIGIPEKELPLIFDRFHRVEGARGRTHEGTGIGLALVQELVKLHNGSVTVDSVFGHGATFTVRVPFGTAHLPPAHIGGQRQQASTATHADAFVSEALRWLPDGVVQDEFMMPGVARVNSYVSPTQQRMSVLVADDNADMRDYLIRLLKNHFEVRAVANGRAVLEAARANRPDIILSDVMMPGLDGFALLRELRADPELRTIPIILVSARAGEESRIEGLNAGADEYLVKPFSAHELIARVDSQAKLTLVRRQNEELLRQAHTELQSRTADLARFNQMTVGREIRLIELKKEINDLLEQFGEAPRYQLHPDEHDSASVPAAAYRTKFEPCAPLDSILRTERLQERVRPPDYETESHALTALAQSLADSPRMILQTLVDKTLEVLRAGSAGVSLLTKDGKRFYWAAIAGQWSPHRGGGTPRDFGPCGDVLDRNAPLLFTHWERRYPYLAEATPLAEEGLLVPFRVAGKPVGTIWVIAHDANQQFDAEDLRLLESLARFASAAYQVMESLEAIEERRAALNLLEDAVNSQRMAEEANRKLREEIVQRQRVQEALECSEQLLSVEAQALARLNESSWRLWRCQNLREGLSEMLRAVLELLGADKGHAQLLNPNGILTIGAQHGFDREFLEHFREVSAEHDSACGRALKSGQTVIIEDVDADTSYESLRPIAHAESYRAVISTPLIAGDGILQGVLTMYFSSVRHPNDQELRRLDLYIRQASDFIHRCKTEDALRASEAALREQDRLKNEFLALLGHELRNPLAPIYNTSELLSRTIGEQPQVQAGLDVIRRQTKQLTRMVEDLLDVARITQGRITLQRETVELSSVISQGIETVAPLLGEKQHQLSIVSSWRPLHVYGDAARLAQCISNLLSNAAKYTDPGGRIRIETREEGPFAIIEVADNGCGISEALLPRVFELFVQGDQTLDRARGGLGIGLQVVKKLVEMHGGEVSAFSGGTGKGATFQIRLPQVERVLVVAQPEEASSIPPKRIFIVDDNQDAVEALAGLLQLEGHEVQIATSSKEALERMEAFGPEVALLDIGLPEMNGYELLRKLQSSPALQSVRFIAVTGYGQAEDRERARDAGFESHLVKPVSMSALTRALIGPSTSSIAPRL